VPIRARLTSAFATDGDPYAGADLPTARRLGGLLWLIASAVAAFLLPLSPPDEAIGDWGWLVAGSVILTGFAGGRVFLRTDLVRWDAMLASSYVGAAQVAVLQWLAGGHGAPYAELYLIVVLYAAALHPPRRLAGVLAAIAAASAAPLVYDAASAQAFSQILVRLVLLSALAFLAATLMKTVRAQRLGLRSRGDEAEHLARQDELTGLPNRRAFTETVAAEVARARRSGAPLSVVVADLDGFKRINDTFGHPAGDACLRAIGAALHDARRQYDSCFRWGGDEFTIILPATALPEAELVCDRVAAVVGACRAPDGVALRITCAAAELHDGMTGEDLVLAADEALLARKRRGGLRLASTA
jgi:diguanylate cyclase (GGDEF)-like protein